MRKLLAIMTLFIGFCANAQTVDLFKPVTFVSDSHFSIRSSYDRLGILDAGTYGQIIKTGLIF